MFAIDTTALQAIVVQWHAKNVD